MHRLLLPVLAVFAAAIAAAEVDFNALARQAIETIDWDFEDRWTFTETRLDDGKLWVGRYDPRQKGNERWQLVSVNGREPTDDEIEDYIDDQGEPDASEKRNVEALVKPDTFRLISETDEYWLLEFVPDENNEELLAHVQATMKIIKDGTWIAYIDLRSDEPFRPGFGVKMQEFVTAFRFGPATADGPIVPLGIDARVKGRAFLVISFDETEQLSYSDFEYVGD